MLTVSYKQIAELQIQTRQSFIIQMILYVQEKFPNNYKELNAKELETKIEQLIKQADSYCLKTRNYVKLFIAYSCQYKWDGIIGNEEIRSIFLNREYSAKEKFIIVNQILENN